MDDTRRPVGAVVALVVLGAAALVDLVVMAGTGVAVVRSATAPGPGEPGYGAVDPHGYVLVFGTVVLVVGALVLVGLGVGLAAAARRVGSVRRRSG